MTNNKIVINDFGEFLESAIEENEQKKSNEIDLDLCYQNKSGIITDTCNIHLEKDLKICRVLLPKIINNKKFINIVKNYIFDNLGMEEIIISTDNNTISKELLSYGFENLGQDNNLLHFIIDKIN